MGGIYMGRKFIVTDCEGPISLNDNAFELSGHFIEDGERFFEILSKYDDVLADEIKRPSYNAGGTLKFIVPFLKAYGANNQNVTDFSNKNIHLLNGAANTLKFINQLMPSFIVSTSYNPYIDVLCSLTGFPFNNTYSTELDLDNMSIDESEIAKLKLFRERIMENPDFDVLEEIFFKEMPELMSGGLIEKVKPIGGEGKKEAVLDIISKHNLRGSDLLYIGDSITDVQALKYANNEGGVALSFNGNEYAIRESDISVIADNTVITSIIADLFNKYGTESAIEFAISFSEDPDLALKAGHINQKLVTELLEYKLPEVEIVTCNNMDRIIERSSNFRKKLRGESVGGLG
jgi:energy-converting hydrogenase A subunit R